MKRVTDKIELWTLDDFATNEECDELIKTAYKCGFQESTVQDIANNIDKPNIGAKTFSRNSNTSFIKRDSPLSIIFHNKAKKILDTMGKKYGFVEDIQVQRYKKNQKYNPHYDTFDTLTGKDQRSWTIMCYLGSGSDKEELEGGGTLFTKINTRVLPKKGTAVIWNNLDGEYCRQQDTMHMGEEVLKGTKYIVTIWFRNPEGTAYHCVNMNSFNTEYNTNTASKKSIEKFDSNTDTISQSNTPISVNMQIGIIILLLFLILCLLCYLIYNIKKQKY